MKINQNRGRGRGQGNGHANAGPLMTDHLRVRNLDRELQMLRHKREVVQREQQILTLECAMDRKRQYEQPNRNVSNMYSNPWQPPPSKRLNAPRQPSPWMNAPPYDSFGPNSSKRVSSDYIPSLLSKPVNPPMVPVSMKPIVHPILNNPAAQRPVKPHNVRKDFRPTQVMKKKAFVPPNKLNSYSVKERKNLMSQATDSLLPKNNAIKFQGESTSDLVLRDDEIPSRQVVGRLELALGTIVKEIKSSDTSNALSTKPTYPRSLKQAVRERLRTVMLNKHVGSVIDIVNHYRKKFPKQSDKEVIDSVINSQQTKIVKVTETESPEEFFKKNITNILDTKIPEVFANLRKMYSTGRHKTSGSYYVKAGNKNSNESAEKASVLNDEAMKILRGITGKYCTSEEKDILTRYYTELIGQILEVNLPEYLPKCKDEIIKILDLDHQFKTVKMLTAKQLKAEGKVKKEDKDRQIKNEENTETSDQNEALQVEGLNNDKIDNLDAIENNEMEHETDGNTNEKEDEEDDKNNEVNDETVDENNEMNDDANIKHTKTEEDRVTENNDTQKPTETVHGKETTTEANKAQEMTPVKQNQAAEKSLIQEKSAAPTPMKTQQSSEAKKSATPIPKKIDMSPVTSKSPITVSTPAGKELPFYVKLIGRPTLPNRAVICEFLNSFRPSSIKKHKSINNLLVIGFSNEEDYNKILQANETVMDGITIIIKASEKVTPGKENEGHDVNNSRQKENKAEEEVKETKENKAEEVKENKEENKTEQVKDGNEICKEKNNKSDDLIGKDLDEQITDLLTTIKNADEDASKNEDADKSAKQPLEPIEEDAVEVKNGKTSEPEVIDKNAKANVKESGRATPVRSSSRLATVTPSTIRTRRASRLMQE